MAGYLNAVVFKLGDDPRIVAEATICLIAAHDSSPGTLIKEQVDVL